MQGHRRRAALSLVLIVSAALALRIFLFVGYASVDPWDDDIYLELAEQVRNGTIDATIARADATLDAGRPVEPGSGFVTRRGTIYPTAFAQAVFGANEIASALPSLLSSLAMVVITYWLGYRLGGEHVAGLSALLVAVVPLHVIYATRILADAPTAFWFTASLACAIEAHFRTTSRSRRVFYALAGVALFIGYTTRITALLALPLLALATRLAPESRAPTRNREPLLMLAPLLLGLTVEGLYYSYTTGRFFFILELERATSLWMFTHLPQALFHPFAWVTVHLSFEEGTLHHFFKLFWGTVDHYGGLKSFGLYAPLGALAALAAMAKPRRETGFLIIWVVATFLFFQYGPRAIEWQSGELHYFLVGSRIRYLMPLLPPLMILMALAIDSIRIRAPRITALMVVGLVLYGCFESYRSYRFYRESLEDLRAANRFLVEEPGPLFTDAWAQRQLRSLSRSFDGPLLSLRAQTPQPGSLVLIGGSRGFDLASEDVAAWLPEPFAALHLRDVSPPTGWKEVFRRHAEHQVARQTDLRIYRVP